MIKDIFINKKYSDIRLIIVVSVSLTLLLWIKDSLEISCLLSFFQNVLLVLYITTSILNRMNINKVQRIKNGMIIGGSIGILYGTMMFLVEDIKYYFFGGRLQTARDLGLPFIPLSNDLIMTELISQFWIWFFLVLLSLSFGFVGGVISKGQISEK